MSPTQTMAKIAIVFAELIDEANVTITPKEFIEKLNKISIVLFGDKD
jgi:hypothetical protein